MRGIGVLVVIALLAISPDGPASLIRAEGKLDKVRDEVREPSDKDDNDDDMDDKDKKDKETKRDCHESRNDYCAPYGGLWSNGSTGSCYHQPNSVPEYDDGDSCNGFEDLLGPVLLIGAAAPWWLPHFASEGDEWTWAEFPPAPYWDDHDGFLALDDPFPPRLKEVSLRLSEEYGTDFDGLSRIGTHVIADTSSRFGLDSQWNHWIERVPHGHDSLDTGDFNLVFRFAQHEKVQFHSGLGFNWLADSRQADFGFNFTYSLDLFPAKPWVLSSVMDAGTLGEATFFHVRASAGVVIRHAEIFTGYDYQNIEGVDLQGLLAGVRLWF